MADVVLYKGGTPEIQYLWNKNTPVLYGPPFGHLGKADAPPFDAHYEAEMGGKGTFAAGYPLIPHLTTWQQVNIRAFNPGVGDVLQMLVVPCNHYIESIRLDVVIEDPLLAGTTVAIAGQWIQESATDPTQFGVTPSTEIAAAAAAQSGTGISLAVKSSTVIWLNQDVGGYVQPLYVKPALIVPPGKTRTEWFQGGGLILGLKIEAITANMTLDRMPGAVFLTTRIDGYECPSSV
ncbi:MAG: hypothetical protein LBQ12_14190 [Deltaproteobacteria bacterium]|jgi:hypothetical protein|nr:hypothetical protein [Deltaproteobacteria bacterium]